MDDVFTVASFDVGVRNLAFCVMQYDSKGNCFPVLDWKNVDLSDSDDIEDHMCCAFLKTRKDKDGNPVQCPRGAKLCIEDCYYCAIHNPDKNKYKIKEKPKVKAMALKSIFMEMRKVLDTHEEIWKTKVDHVIIERQFNKNRTMIFQSGLLYSYFLLNHLTNVESRISDVKVIHAKNKLCVYNGPKVTVNRKNAKDKRKLLAVEYCKYMLRKDNERLAYLNKYPKKKDDLSDCFLQGAWYLKFGKHPQKGRLKKNLKT